MANWLHALLRPFRAQSGSKTKCRNVQAARRSWRLDLECLEDRTVPSTFSSIASNFNGTAIPAGDSIWFNAAFKASGLGAGPVSIHVTDQVINFSAGGTDYAVNVPDSILNFSAANTVASTSFDAAQNAWVTNLPMSWSGNAFLGGATFVAPSDLPGGINPVTWSGNFATDTPGVSLKWQWGAAVYTSFSSDYNALNVKPLDSNSATAYHNSDHAGTPEASKSFVIGGARGGGGSNWTGSYSSTASVVPAGETFVQPADISGHVYDAATLKPLSGVTITMTGTVNGITVVRTTTTNEYGYYEFSEVAPGSYTLMDSPAVGYTPSSADAGTVSGEGDGTVVGVNEIADIGLGSGDIAINYDFYQDAQGPPRT